MTDNQTVSPWLTSAEAATYLKVEQRTLLAWSRSGKAPAHQLSGSKRITWRFLKSELDAMLSPPAVLPTEGRPN